MSEQRTLVGWREWLALPGLNIPNIEAKVDTGTQTSVLHTSFIEPFHQNGKLWVRFGIHPLPERSDVRMIGFEPVVDRRMVKDTEGVDETCFVVETMVSVGEMNKTIELILTEKDAQKFRLILGRTALQKLNLFVHPDNKYLMGNFPAEETVRE